MVRPTGKNSPGLWVLVRVETALPKDLSQKPEESDPTSWSLFRLIESGAPAIGENDNEIECEWLFEYHPKAGDKQQRKAQLTLTAVFDPMVQAENPFQKDFFRRFEFVTDTQIFNPYEPRENRMEVRSDDGEPER